MRNTFNIETQRLALIGADGVLLRAQLAGRQALAHELDLDVPLQWPPEHLDEPAIRWTLDIVEKLPADAIWRMYFVVLADPIRVVIGTCGFKGPPDVGGTAEIGYSFLPAYWNRGYGSEAAQALVEIAFRRGAREVVAETYPALIASRRVMEKCGMTYVGPGADLGVIRFAIRAPELR